MGYIQLSTIGPLHRAELVDIHLVVFGFSACMVITTSLVEKGYEAGFRRSQVGHQKVTRGWLGGTLSSSAWRDRGQILLAYPLPNHWRICPRTTSTSSLGIDPEHPCNNQAMHNPKLTALDLALFLVPPYSTA